MLREVAAEAGPADAVAITMTAELSDAFRTKREGVDVRARRGRGRARRPLSVLTTAGELVSMAAARARPWDVAAANWVATALAVADAHPDALLIDVGSTTADVIPIAARARRRDRPQRPRAAAGRASSSTPACCAPTSRRSRRACRSVASGARCRRSTSRSAPTSISCSAIWRRRPTTAPRPTAARPRSRSRASASPGWCAPTSSSSTPREIDAIAAFLARRAAAPDRGRGAPRARPAEAPVVAVGSGAFLGREVAARLGRAVADSPRPSGPAAALAALLAARLC